MRPLESHFQTHRYTAEQLRELVVQEVRTQLEADWETRGSWVAAYISWPAPEAQAEGLDPDEIEAIDYATVALIQGCEEVLEVPQEATPDLDRLETILAGMTEEQLQALIMWASDLLQEFYAGLGADPVNEDDEFPGDSCFITGWRPRVDRWR